MSLPVAPVALSRRLTRVNIYSQADFGSASHRNMERIGPLHAFHLDALTENTR